MHGRTLFFIVNYVVMLASCVYGYGSIALGGLPGFVVLVLGTLFGLGCLTVAVLIHRGFPEEHSRASDFAQLRTTGPYRHVRHPFYSALIALNYFASMAFSSLDGIIASTVLLPAWWYLARSEERDLIQEWGSAYIEYRRVTPMFFPRLGRKPVSETGT